MKITLLDGKNIEVPNNATVRDVAKTISKSLEKVCFGALVNDVYKSLNDIVKDKDKVNLLTDKNNNEQENALNNSIRLVIAKSLIDNFKGLKIINYDIDFSREFYEGKTLFDFTQRFKAEDIKKIQLAIDKTISKIQKIEFISNDLTKYSKELLASYGDKKYVTEISNFCKENKITPNVLKVDDSYFVSYYPYIENIANYKISVQAFSGEYWMNDSSNPMIQRISFIAGKNKDVLDQKIKKYEDIKNNDHRFIGKNLEIFALDPLIGQGLPIWLPNGFILKNTIKNFLRDKEWEYDFIPVESPVIGTSELYKISGHWDHYKDDMFTPMIFPKEELVLRPMTCPHHIQIFKSKQRSYKELPMRIAEHANLFRYESSGSLTGLERVRSMELTDSHIFVRQDQIKNEFMHCYRLIEETLKTFNINIDYLSLSLRDKNDKEKYYQDDKMWDTAEAELEQVLNENKIEYKKMIGEAAFYGPKLDIQIRTVLGHEITVSTLQLDFLLPSKFNIEYINNENKPTRPIIIHRGLIGTYERFIAILLEQTKGVLPLWLSPTQVQIIPVSNDPEIINYCQSLNREFKLSYIRSNIDERDERLSYKIREAQIKKIPYQIVIGKEELDNETISYRLYGSEDSKTVKSSQFIKKINEQIKDKK